MSPVEARPGLVTAIFGGRSPGTETNCSSLSSCPEFAPSNGGVVASRPIVNERWTVAEPAIRIVAETDSPAVNGTLGTQLAPRRAL